MTTTTSWDRVLSAAAAGDTLLAQVSLNHLLRQTRPPEDAVLDVAVPYADAFLTNDATLPAWTFVAKTVLAHTAFIDGVSPLQLAWELARRAAEMAPPEQTPEHVMLLATLQHHAGHVGKARDLARGAQQAARAAKQAQAFIAATWLLADLADDDDAPEVIRHGLRWLHDMGADVDADELRTTITEERPEWLTTS